MVADVSARRRPYQSEIEDAADNPCFINVILSRSLIHPDASRFYFLVCLAFSTVR